MDNYAPLYEAACGSVPVDLLKGLAGANGAKWLKYLMAGMVSDDRRIRTLEMLRERPDARYILCGMSRDVIYDVLLKFTDDRYRLRALALLHATLSGPGAPVVPPGHDMSALLGCFADDRRPEAVRELCTLHGVPRRIGILDVSFLLTYHLGADANRLRALTYLVEAGALVFATSGGSTFVDVDLGRALRSVDRAFGGHPECAAALVLVWRAYEAERRAAIDRRQVKTVLDASVTHVDRRHRVVRALLDDAAATEMYPDHGQPSDGASSAPNRGGAESPVRASSRDGSDTSDEDTRGISPPDADRRWDGGVPYDTRWDTSVRATPEISASGGACGGIAVPDEKPGDHDGLPDGADDASACVVCAERLRTAVCVPCGHMCLCVPCARKTVLVEHHKTCVTCRTPLSAIVRLMMP